MAPDDLTWLLSKLVDKVPHTRSVVLLTVDGLKKNWVGIDADDADRLAATAASMCALARQIGRQVGGTDGLRQLIAELDGCIVFITAASAGSVLAITAGTDVDSRNLSYEATHLCSQVAARFATQTRGVGAVGNGT